MSFYRKPATVVATLLLVAGCGTTPTGKPFAPVSFGLGVSSESNAKLGDMEVTLHQASVRKVLATVSEVKRYRLTLTGNGLSEPLVKECPAPEGSNGKVSLRFNDLAPGEYSMTVDALGEDGTVLGSDTKTATVVRGKCIYVNLNVKLDPTYIDNRNGHLGALITVEDGDVIEKPIEECPAVDGFAPLCAPSPSASVSLEFKDLDSDFVSLFAPGANGQPDAHHKVTISSASPLDIAYIRLINSGGYSTTAPGFYGAALTVVYLDGVRVNENYTSHLGTFTGPVTLDVYTESMSGYPYEDPSSYYAEVVLTDGTVLR